MYVLHTVSHGRIRERARAGWRERERRNLEHLTNCVSFFGPVWCELLQTSSIKAEQTTIQPNYCKCISSTSCLEGGRSLSVEREREQSKKSVAVCVCKLNAPFTCTKCTTNTTQPRRRRRRLGAQRRGLFRGKLLMNLWIRDRMMTIFVTHPRPGGGVEETTTQPSLNGRTPIEAREV